MVRINPKKIPGKWREGYALDYHTLRSDFIGHDEYGHPRFDTERSEMGELLYRLKYRSNKAALDPIVDVVSDFIISWELSLNLILPTPPSRSRRPYQPVLEIAKELSLRLNTLEFKFSAILAVC